MKINSVMQSNNHSCINDSAPSLYLLVKFLVSSLDVLDFYSFLPWDRTVKLAIIILTAPGLHKHI